MYVCNKQYKHNLKNVSKCSSYFPSINIISNLINILYSMHVLHTTTLVAFHSAENSKHVGCIVSHSQMSYSLIFCNQHQTSSKQFGYDLIPSCVLMLGLNDIALLIGRICIQLIPALVSIIHYIIHIICGHTCSYWDSERQIYLQTANLDRPYNHQGRGMYFFNSFFQTQIKDSFCKRFKKKTLWWNVFFPHLLWTF